MAPRGAGGRRRRRRCRSSMLWEGEHPWGPLRSGGRGEEESGNADQLAVPHSGSSWFPSEGRRRALQGGSPFRTGSFSSLADAFIEWRFLEWGLSRAFCSGAFDVPERGLRPSRAGASSGVVARLFDRAPLRSLADVPRVGSRSAASRSLGFHAFRGTSGAFRCLGREAFERSEGGVDAGLRLFGSSVTSGTIRRAPRPPAPSAALRLHGPRLSLLFRHVAWLHEAAAEGCPEDDPRGWGAAS